MRRLFLILLFAAGCRPERPAPKADARPSAPAPAQADGWLAGELPASVLEGEPTPGGSVTIRAYYEPASVNPISTSDGLSEWIVLHNVTEALLRPDPYDDPDYRLLPSLAARWTRSDDARIYTFELQPGVKWHDGRPFTSADVLATFEKVRSPKVKALNLRPLFELLDEIDAPDAHTVRFIWKQPYFLALRAIAKVPIQPAHVIKALSPEAYNDAATNRMNRAPIGTGPFRFVEWTTGEKIVLERNDDYWGKKAWLSRVVYRIVPDHTIARELTRNEEIDVWDAVQPHMWQDMNDPTLRTRFHRVRYNPASYVFIGYNARRPQLKDARVRQALTKLFPRRGLIERIQYGLVRPTGCHFYWASKDCDPSLLGSLDPDLPGALKLLAKAGWTDHDGDGVLDQNGVPLRFSLMIYPQSTVSERVATLMKEDYRKAGIEVEIQKVEWSAMVRRLDDGEFDATVLQWDTGAEHDPTVFWHSKSVGNGSNYFAFRNLRADEIMEAARVELDAERRHALFRELGVILKREQPITWLYSGARLGLVHRRLRGVRPSLEWWQPRDWWISSPTQGAR